MTRIAPGQKCGYCREQVIHINSTVYSIEKCGELPHIFLLTNLFQGHEVQSLPDFINFFNLFFLQGERG